MDIAQVFASSVRNIVPELRRRRLGYVCAEPDGGWLLPYDGRRLESSFYRTYWAALEVLQHGFLTIDGQVVAARSAGCRFLLRVAGSACGALFAAREAERPGRLHRMSGLWPRPAARTRTIHAWGTCPVSNAPIHFGVSADRGFVFEVAHDLPMARRRAPNESTDLLQRTQDRVLVVDDDVLVAKVMRLMVESLGYGGVSVHDGADAVEACRRFAPIAIIMDCQMRRVGGIEATRRIRALQRTGELPPCRIVMVTGDLEAATRSAAFEAGVDAFLPKPVMLEQVDQQLRSTA